MARLQKECSATHGNVSPMTSPNQSGTEKGAPESLIPPLEATGSPRKVCTSLPTRIKGTLSSKTVDQLRTKKSQRSARKSAASASRSPPPPMHASTPIAVSIETKRAAVGEDEDACPADNPGLRPLCKNLSICEGGCKVLPVLPLTRCNGRAESGYLWGTWLENRLSFGGRFIWGVHTVPWDHSSYIAHQDHSFTVFKSSCDRLCRTSYH